MKREDIKKHFPEATDEQINALLDINSTDIGKVKKERDTYKSELETVQGKLKEFDGVDAAALQEKIRTLTNDLETAKLNHTKELENIRFNSVLEDKVRALNPKNAKLVMALLDVEKLRESKNQDADITAALDAVKKENDYLFPADKPAPRIISGTDTTQQGAADRKAQANEAIRALIGKEN